MGELLSKSAKTLPPMAAAVLVAVAGENVVQELVDINQHFLVMFGGVEECVGGDWCFHPSGVAGGDGSHC